MKLRSLAQVEKELEKRGIPFERRKGRIDTSMIATGHTEENNETDDKWRLAFANSNGHLCSVLYDTEQLYGNDFCIDNDDTPGHTDNIEKVRGWWRVVKMPREDETVEDFVQDGLDYFAKLEEHMKNIVKNEFKMRLETNILNGTLNEFAKTLNNMKISKWNSVITGQTQDKLNIKTYWKDNQGGKEKIIKIFIKKGKNSSLFHCKWKTGLNIREFLDRSIEAHKMVYGDRVTEK